MDNSANVARYRYPGVVNFTISDQHIFFGRDLDQEKLKTKILLNRTVVLHAESGAGKSSLIQAGVLPKLEGLQIDRMLSFNDDAKKSQIVPVIIRFVGNRSTDHKDDTNPEDELILETVAAIKRRFSGYKLEPLPYIKDHNAGTLWLECKMLEYNGYIPYLVFDQFEEIQSYKIQQINCFKVAMGQAFAHEVPKNIYSQLKHAINDFKEREGVQNTDNRKVFSETISFLEEDLKIHAVFVVREDKLGAVSLLGEYFPDILKNDYFLKPLDVERATEAIVKPAQKDGNFLSKVFTYETDAIEHIIKELKDKDSELIDPIQIQIVCSDVERNLVKDSVGIVIKASDIRPLKDIIRSFYSNAWDSVFLNYYAGKEEKFIRDKKSFLEKLVIKGKRNLVNAELLKTDAETSNTVDALLGIGLIREVVDGDSDFYRLCHDRFVAPIVEDIALLELTENTQAEIRRNNYDNERRLHKLRKNFLIGMISVIVMVFCIILYQSLKNVEKEEERKILTIGGIIRRTNPTLSYNLVKNWLQSHNSMLNRRTESEEFLKKFDSLKYGYLIGFFPLENPVVFADANDAEKTLSIFDKNAIYIWNTKSGMLKAESRLAGTPIIKHFRLNRKWLNAVQREHNIEILEESGRVIKSFSAVASKGDNFKISPKGNFVCIDNMIYSWRTRNKIAILPNERGAFVTSKTFLNDKDHIAAGYSNGSIIIYQIDSNSIRLNKIAKINDVDAKAAIQNIASDTTMKYLAASNSKNHLLIFTLKELYDAKDKNSVDSKTAFNKYRMLTGHSDLITQIVISPDNKLVMTTSKDHSAIITELSTGIKRAVLRGRDEEVVYGNFSSDGKSIVTSSVNKRIMIWKLDPPSQLYVNKELVRFSSFNYDVTGIPRAKDRGKVVIAKDLKIQFRNTLEYLTNLPVNNQYPDDPYYCKVLATSVREVKIMHSNLIKNKNYVHQISPANRRMLASSYGKLIFNESDLLQTNISVINNYTRLNLANIDVLLTDTLDLTKALIYGRELNETAEAYRDGNEFAKAITCLYGNKRLLNAFQNKQRQPNAVLNKQQNVCYANLILNYLFIMKLDSAELFIRDFKNIRNGAGMAQVRQIQLLLLKDKIDDAKILYERYESKQMMMNDPRTLAQLLYPYLEQFAARGLHKTTILSFIDYMKNRPSPIPGGIGYL